MARRVPPDCSNPASATAPRPTVPNRILSLLPAEELRALAPHLKRVQLDFDDIIVGHGDPIETVYFPESSIVSATLTMEDGRTAEVGTMGNESAAGLSAWTGVDVSPTTLMCQIAGTAQAMPLEAVKREAARLPQFETLLHRTVQALWIQTMHSTVCNALHSVEERLARWLLMTHDRVQSDNMPLTQQFLAYMLGVYRPSVTIVARTLQNAGLITYERGSVTIVDRDGLEAASCECYRANRDAADALVPPADMGEMQYGASIEL